MGREQKVKRTVGKGKEARSRSLCKRRRQGKKGPMETGQVDEVARVNIIVLYTFLHTHIHMISIVLLLI
jgi:hypothetical protein